MSEELREAERREVFKKASKKYWENLPKDIKKEVYLTKKNRPQYKAQYTLRNAVRLGNVTKEPCFICGSKKSQGHHEDYDKLLQVTWLCSLCHSRVHRGVYAIDEIRARWEANG